MKDKLDLDSELRKHMEWHIPEQVFMLQTMMRKPHGFCSILSEMDIDDIHHFPSWAKKYVLSWVCHQVDIWEKPDGTFVASLVCDETSECPISTHRLPIP